MAIPLTLKVFKGEALITSRDFERDIIKIGRLSSAHLRLEDEKVSRVHSVIETAADGTLSIIDMGSVEGTWVNGKRVTKSRLSFGDEIRLGGTTLRLESPTAVAAVNLAAAVSSTEVTSMVEPASTPVEALEASLAPPRRHEVLAPVSEAAPAEPSQPVRTVRRNKARGQLGVSLCFLWGDQRVGEFFIPPGRKKSFTVGSAAGVDFVMGDARLGGSCLEVLRTDGQTFTVLFTSKMKGKLVRAEETLDLEAVIESGRATHEGEAYALVLDADDFFRVDLGGVTLEASFRPAPRRVHVPWTDSVDYRALNIFLLMFFAGSMFVIHAANRAGDEEAFSDELSSNPARIAKLIIKPPEVQQNRLLAQLNERRAQQEQRREAATRKPDKPSPPREPKPSRSTAQQKPGERANAIARNLFGSGKGSIASVFGGSGLSGDLRSALGRVSGPQVGATGLFGGPGLRGPSGPGGPGHTIGLTGIGIPGRSSGNASYGNDRGLLTGKQSVDVGLAPSTEWRVEGSLDKDLIREVIQRNKSQIRYCYENLLGRYPNLGGKVQTQFTINAQGQVITSTVAQSTAGNAELEQCVAGRVSTWQFPKPKGGGVVVVSYPFLFKQAGQ